mmetsp:Transcript_13379/g.31658  ORF Transcript_13379/g.31658 Transcript_13379/m.31658 type:complete len:285 (+) Transcript_13379:596-1450(+)
MRSRTNQTALKRQILRHEFVCVFGIVLCEAWRATVSHATSEPWVPSCDSLAWLCHPPPERFERLSRLLGPPGGPTHRVPHRHPCPQAAAPWAVQIASCFQERPHPRTRSTSPQLDQGGAVGERRTACGVVTASLKCSETSAEAAAGAVGFVEHSASVALAAEVAGFAVAQRVEVVEAVATIAGGETVVSADPAVVGAANGPASSAAVVAGVTDERCRAGSWLGVATLLPGPLAPLVQTQMSAMAPPPQQQQQQRRRRRHGARRCRLRQSRRGSWGPGGGGRGTS